MATIAYLGQTMIWKSANDAQQFILYFQISAMFGNTVRMQSVPNFWILCQSLFLNKQKKWIFQKNYDDGKRVQKSPNAQVSWPFITILPLSQVRKWKRQLSNHFSKSMEDNLNIFQRLPFFEIARNSTILNLLYIVGFGNKGRGNGASHHNSWAEHAEYA